MTNATSAGKPTVSKVLSGNDSGVGTSVHNYTCDRCRDTGEVLTDCPDEAKYGPYMSCAVRHTKPCPACGGR